MEELKLTIQEARETLLLSQSSVYSWIDKGKLQAKDTPGGKIIVISSKEAEQIREMNLKSRRNKVAKQNADVLEESDNLQENAVINAEIIDTGYSNDTDKPSSDITFKLISRIEELAVEAGRFKQLEILRNEEKENVKYWQEKYHEINAELTSKNLEIAALQLQIQELKKSGKPSIFSFLKKKD